MAIRLPLALAAGSAVLALAPAAPASTFLRTDPGGALVASGATIGGSGGSSTVLVLGLGSSTCTPSFTATVGAGGGAFVIATVSSTSGTFGCGGAGTASVGDCTPLPPASTITFTANASGAHVVWSQAIVRCSLSSAPSWGCYYQVGPRTGTYVNATGTLTFPSAGMQRTVPSGHADDLGAPCGNTAALSVTVGPVRASGTALTVLTS